MTSNGFRRRSLSEKGDSGSGDYQRWHRQPIWLQLRRPPNSWAPSWTRRSGGVMYTAMKRWRLARTHSLSDGADPNPAEDLAKTNDRWRQGNDLGRIQRTTQPGKTACFVGPHAGDWLATLPLVACGFWLSNEAVTVAAGFRLGLTLCALHQCDCGEIVEQVGHHGLICRRSMGIAARHAAINDIILRALSKANIPSSKEPSGLSRTDGKRRPDGATFVPWTRARFIAWDATAIHNCASSYLHLTSTVFGEAAEQAAECKRT